MSGYAAKLATRSPKILVEERAISTDQRGAFLLVVNDQDTVEYRPVRLGLQTDSLRVIEAGIQEGDWIVVNGLQRARPGSKVQPQRATMSGTVEQAGTAAEPQPATADGTDAAGSGGEAKAPQPVEAEPVPGQVPDPTSGVQPPTDSTSPSPAPEEQ